MDLAATYAAAGYTWDTTLVGQHPNSPALLRAMRSRVTETYADCTVPPAVTGTVTVGQTLTSSTGTWLGAAPTYTYQWLRDGAPIAGATVSTYVLVAADQTHLISCRVTATNSGGSNNQTSNAVGPV
jgi:hypothetical protein